MEHEAPRRTLASLLEDRDRNRFTGRAAEVAYLSQCLDAEDPPASVVHICGPGGIGKSSVLREVARRARDRGRTVVVLDGRELGPQLAALESEITEVAGHPFNMNAPQQLAKVLFEELSLPVGKRTKTGGGWNP